MSKELVRAKPPWASGPGEILQHGVSLLQEDSDKNRRLAMLSIDNAVELMIKTYLGLPKRVTGLAISRAEYGEISDSFPRMLDALESHAAEKLESISLGEIEWYHRLRNELYHQGNGLTVEREKVVVYAELAQLLFERLFGFALQISKPRGSQLLGDFITAWSRLEQVLLQVANKSANGSGTADHSRSSVRSDLFWSLSSERLGMAPYTLPPNLVDDLQELRHVRNQVIHGHPEVLLPAHLARLNRLSEQVAHAINTN